MSARSVLRIPGYWGLAIAFCMVGLTHGMVISHIRPIMADRGMAEALAVLAASMIGPMQVFGRLVMVATERRLSTFGAGLACLGGMALGCTALLLATGSPLLVAVFVVVHGGCYGIASIVRPTLTAEFLGRRGFGVISGFIALPSMLGFAAGSSIAAALWRVGGYDLVLAAAIAAPLIGLGALFSAKRSPRRDVEAP